VLPHVIVYNGASVDGRLDWGLGDEGLYYEFVSRWNVDAMLSGSNTILVAQFPEALAESPVALEPSPSDAADARQLLVIVDSRGRIRNWPVIRYQPYWRDAMALCSHATPRSYLDYLKEQQIDYIVAGDDRVDLRAALEELNARYGVQVVRVDSGGILNGVLLRAGLVDEVCVLVNPELVGGTTPRSMFVAPDLTSPAGVIRLRLLDIERVRSDYVWLRYEVVK